MPWLPRPEVQRGYGGMASCAGQGRSSCRTMPASPEGPSEFDCQNRDQVIAWWSGARAAGARAAVTEVTGGAAALLVGLEVTGIPAADEAGGAVERWQVLTLRGGRVADIRGFDDRAVAAARAGVPA